MYIKETYNTVVDGAIERLVFMKRETCIHEKRPMYIERDLGKRPYGYEKKSMDMKRDLYI